MIMSKCKLIQQILVEIGMYALYLPLQYFNAYLLDSQYANI